jgi:glycerol-3-phosphate dehydrogenase
MNFVNERWKGMYPVCWGDTLRESEYSQWVYSGVCGLAGADDCETAETEKK